MKLMPGDEVLVLVDADVFDQKIDRSVRWVVDSVDEFDRTVWIRDRNGVMRNVHWWNVILDDEFAVERTVISLWKRGNHLATADRSECWAQILSWVQQMDQAIERLEREVLKVDEDGAIVLDRNNPGHREWFEDEVNSVNG
jgi:hypothetical protein